MMGLQHHIGLRAREFRPGHRLENLRAGSSGLETDTGIALGALLLQRAHLSLNHGSSPRSLTTMTSRTGSGLGAKASMFHKRGEHIVLVVRGDTKGTTTMMGDGRTDKPAKSSADGGLDERSEKTHNRWPPM